MYSFILARFHMDPHLSLFTESKSIAMALDAPTMVLCCIVEIMEMSRATGCLLFQICRYTSAGQLLVPEIRDGTSFLVAMAAVLAA